MIYLVYGDTFLVRRFVSAQITKQRGEGRSIHTIHADKDMDLSSEVLQTSSFHTVLGSDSSIFVYGADSVKTESVTHLDKILGEDESVSVIFVSYSDSVRWSSKVPPKRTRVFQRPPPWKAHEFAENFLREEFEGLEVSPQILSAICHKVGTDCGFLSWEAQKIRILMDRQNTKTLTVPHLRNTLSPIWELDGSSVMESLGCKDRIRLVSELSRYRSLKSQDPTMELSSVIAYQVCRWVQALHLRESGYSDDIAAKMVGQNAWVWGSKILPPALLWGMEGCRSLIATVSDSQSAVFRGCLNPWVSLEVGLLRLVG